jgi:hypothetical protein
MESFTKPLETSRGVTLGQMTACNNTRSKRSTERRSETDAHGTIIAVVIH